MPDSREERRRRAGRAWTVAGRLRVRSPEDPPSADGALEVVIEPAPGAFGTGAHPTTRGCLELLLELEPGGGLADLGCGSGVVAIAAARLGWEPVYGLDFDERSVEATGRNAQRNGVEVRAVLVDLREIPAPPAHTLVANIPLDIHERVAATLSPATARVDRVGDHRLAGARRHRGLRARRAGAPGTAGRGRMGGAAAGAAVTLALLDPSRAAEAGAPHGQLASAVGGALRVSCHKLVEDAARATILLVPGLLRLDVRPVEDSLQVFARALHPVPPRWELIDGAAVGAATDEPYRLEWRVDAPLEPHPVRGQVTVAMTVDFDQGVAHFVAHAVLREITA